jgi:GT2 family glycosyltransferase
MSRTMPSGEHINVSVVVPAYNAESTLADCIGSLLRLHYSREQVEFIFVDNASTDRTRTILGSYHGQITVLFENKRGAAAARNAGLRHARGEIIAFIDADCVADPDWLKNLILPLHDPKVGIVGGRILAQEPTNKIEAFGETIHDHNLSINAWKPPYAMTANWSSPLAVLESVGLFDEKFLRGQDCDLSYRIVQAGYKLVYQPEAVVYHKNKKTVSGLFMEGCTHGFHSVQLNKKHRVFLQQYGYRRFSKQSYIALYSSLVNALRHSDSARYDFLFNLGKKLGRWCGSLRYLYLNP